MGDRRHELANELNDAGYNARALYSVHGVQVKVDPERHLHHNLYEALHVYFDRDNSAFTAEMVSASFVEVTW